MLFGLPVIFAQHFILAKRFGSFVTSRLSVNYRASTNFFRSHSNCFLSKRKCERRNPFDST